MLYDLMEIVYIVDGVEYEMLRDEMDIEYI